MNWDAIGAIGEIVGAFAVVLSLVYLGTQVRAQNKESRLASIHETVEAQREALRMFLEPQVAEDFLAVLEDYEQASSAQRLRFSMTVMIIFKITQDAYRQHLDKRLDGDMFEGYGLQIADVMANESAQIVWKLRRHQFDSRFRDYLDDLAPGKRLYR